MLFRVILVCVILAASYAAFEIASVWRSFDMVQNPEVDFTTKNAGNQTNLTIVEFISYECTFCRQAYPVLDDFAKTNPDVRLVVRPVPLVGLFSETAAEIAMAAGLQGKFWEMNDAIIGYGNIPDERFYRDTAELLGLDYEKMVKDAEGAKVQDLVGDNAEALQRAGITSLPAIMVGKTVYQIDKRLTLNDLISMVAAERAK